MVYNFNEKFSFFHRHPERAQASVRIPYNKNELYLLKEWYYGKK